MSELSDAAETAGVVIQSAHLGVEWEGDHGSDRWSCVLSHQGRAATFEYFSGMGHRRLRRWAAKAEGTRYRTREGDLFTLLQAVKANLLTPVPPAVADVLSCVLSDAGACDETFDEWAGNLGYDNDSIKALNTYLACQRNGEKVRRLLGVELFEQLRRLEH